ncbi:hypothetical protein C7212DRAFT_344781 [Tuber magnatum]|uniref:Uncharacterized protein n=1 Tax=Tuber magnatum TaxID=42249 RepID=A0A317SPP9_9PEZI|nr:hypothetical protein C7212DRAFT_344781 [Tuber magnatum]
MPSTVPASLSTAHNSNSTGSRAPFSPLPSEIPRTPLNGHFEGLKSHEDSLKTPITPPAAYTEFLKNTVSSPAIQSPRLPPPDLGKSYGYYTTPTTPYAAARRLKIPASPASSNCSPSTESPASSTSRSPSYEEVEGEVRQGGQRQVTVKQVVTTTVTFTPRMSLMPAPKGKRRRID